MVIEGTEVPITSRLVPGNGRRLVDGVDLSDLQQLSDQ
jgi:hypothetical protein